MTETQDNSQEQGQETIRTAEDLRFEELTRRLDALESENRELREANKGLWAAAHPAPTVQETVQEAPQAQRSDGDVQALYNRFGVI